uniref:Uncharacterized protein n=1 Tax=viral metagenome TaxID=1070528 RepID=A0A6C0E5K9_9ZZZZ
MAANILQAFNDHFFEFVKDVENVFPNDEDVLVAKNSLSTIRKANPKMIIKIWSQFVVGKYKPEIEKGDIDFFINKDYSADIGDTGSSSYIMDAIDRFRSPIKQMKPDDQKKAMKYIQNLTKLADIYNSGK